MGKQTSTEKHLRAQIAELEQELAERKRAEEK